MNVKMKSLFVLLGLLVATGCSAADDDSSSVVGSWACRPYSIPGNIRSTVTQHLTYNRDHTLVATVMNEEFFSSGARVTDKIMLRGRWKLSGKHLYSHFDRARFLSTDNPRNTVQMGQKNLELAMKKTAETSEIVMQFGPPLVTRSSTESNNLDKILVTCDRD